MRGIRLDDPRSRGKARISPAHAGNTVSLTPRERGCSDQPRTCGEYLTPPAGWLTRRGSAPHMRGIRWEGARSGRPRRISPAHAGNTGMIFVIWRRGWDQPRTCGEYAEGARARAMGGGSAPHMRGIPQLFSALGPLPRISPAHAGNTRPRRKPQPPLEDQPRTCGEYKAARLRLARLRGSAPHMRGILLGEIRYSTDGGISPAHAGNTAPALFDALYFEDQPRTCGEYLTKAVSRSKTLGSAPHMRGILHDHQALLDKGGISPAHAGNTLAD